MPHLSAIIPVYNERATIEEIIRRVRAVDIDKEILIIDDGSTDGTREFLIDLAEHCSLELAAPIPFGSGGTRQKDDIRVFFQDTNCGKGAALRRGFREARGEIVIVQDADLEYDPQNFYQLIEPIERGQADAVYGSRFLGGPHRVLFFWHYVGNKFLTTLSDMVTDLNLSDVWTCYKAFKRDMLEQIDLHENRFGFEQEITCRIARNGWRIYEVPISYYGRIYAEG
jgi:glycosyltransferase involved in cell wall biosynthesis